MQKYLQFLLSSLILMQIDIEMSPAEKNAIYRKSYTGLQLVVF